MIIFSLPHGTPRAIASKVVPGHAQSVHDHKLVGMSSEAIHFTQESVDASGGSKKGGVSGEAKLEARRKPSPKRPLDQTRARHVSSRRHFVLLFVRPPCVSQQPWIFLSMVACFRLAHRIKSNLRLRDRENKLSCRLKGRTRHASRCALAAQAAYHAAWSRAESCVGFFFSSTAVLLTIMRYVG